MLDQNPALVIEPEFIIEDIDEDYNSTQTYSVDGLFSDVEDVDNRMLTRDISNMSSSNCDHAAVCIESDISVNNVNTNVPNPDTSKETQPRCAVKSDKFIMYYFTLLFLLCFATPVLITTSLNVYITTAVRATPYDNISNHQWLTLAACVVMWCPCLTERMLSKWGVINDRLPVSVFLFLLGHTHNLLR